MLEGWNGWMGKKVFLRLINGRVYTGEIIKVDSKNSPIIFITIKDRYGMMVCFSHSEIKEIKEEA